MFTRQLVPYSVSLGSSLSSVIMERSKLKVNQSRQGWSKEQQDFCLEQYHLNRGLIVVVRRLYCEKFRVLKRDMQERCPSIEEIKKWVKIEEEKKTSRKFNEGMQNPKQSKLSGSQWGRKTGENRSVKTESIDIGLEHRAMKWKQRDVKWNGPRPVNEKEKVIVKPVEEVHHNYYYKPPIVEDVKPDKKQVLQEKFQENVLELVQSLNASGHAAREEAFVCLRAALQRRAVDGLLCAHRATLADHVSRALRRGKDAERKAAAAIAPLLALQVGEEGTEQFVREVRPALAATATDTSASLDTRTECCSSLAVLSYLMKDEILDTMRIYETIFSGSYPKDGSVKVSREAVEEGAWHAAALDGWALLLPLLPRNHALSLLHKQGPSFARLGEMLDAASLEVRMAAGGALAIAYETVSDGDNTHNALADDVDVLLPRLNELARESNKFHSKKDRKIQRATFREILKFFEEGAVRGASVRAGTAALPARSCAQCAAHAALASALGGALHVLAPRTAPLRAALALPAQPTVDADQPNKLQRHLQNKASSKSRNFVRNKNRDKRLLAGLAN